MCRHFFFLLFILVVQSHAGAGPAMRSFHDLPPLRPRLFTRKGASSPSPMTPRNSACSAFQPPTPLSPLYFRPRAAPSLTPLSVRCRCVAENSYHSNRSHITRRAFIANLVNAVFIASVPAKADNQPPQSSPQPPAPSQPPSPKRPIWGYQPENGPQRWSTLSDDWRLAATGTRQSPIPLSYRSALPANDIPRPTLATNPAKFTVRLRTLPSARSLSLYLEPYLPPPPPLVGDAPPVDTYTPPPIPALITLSPTSPTYALKALHFHVTAEHTIEAASAPIELHCVFERALRRSPPPTPQPPPLSTSGDQITTSSNSTRDFSSLAASSIPLVQHANAADQPTDTADPSAQTTPPTTLIVALLGTISPESTPWLNSVLTDFTDAAGEDGKGPGIVVDLDMASVIPPFEQSDMFMYTGSLTTPPCTEGVQWIVLPSRFAITQSDVDAIKLLQGGPNARPLQDTNDRQVVRFTSMSSSSAT